MSSDCPQECYKRVGCPKPVRFGFYYRTSDRRKIQRYRCARCGRYFSQASNLPAYHQKKRHLNHKIFQLLASGVSQRRVSLLLKIHQKTVSRKLKFLGNQSRYFNLISRHNHPLIEKLQFDDLETFEHTKMKPLSVTLAVEKDSRFIVGFEVSRMPAKGLLAKRAIKKYGFRKDERRYGRERLFRKIAPQISKSALLQSDENPHYPESVKKHFPEVAHETVKGQRGAITGQGELKKIAFDPLFSLNHTCAMFRANINRLFRKTWCTTKKLQSLIDHIDIYVAFHNGVLISP